MARPRKDPSSTAQATPSIDVDEALPPNPEDFMEYVDIRSLNLHQKMLRIQDEVRSVTKDTKVEFRSTSYRGVSHDAVVVAVREAAIRNGVLISPSVTKWEDLGTRFNVEMTTRFTNVDNPADFIDVVTVGQGMDTQDKASGKAQSYAKKYGLLLALQLETKDGDETRPSREDKFTPDVPFIEALLAEKNIPVQDVLDSFGIQSLDQLTQDQYVRVVRKLR